MMKKNFKKLKQFEANLEALNEHKDLFIRQMANELATIFFTEVKKRTPVGKGTFEVVGKIKRGKNKGKVKLKKISQGGSLRRSWYITKAIKHRNYYIASIVNPMEYASYVENGHRQKVGRYVPVLGKRLKTNFVEGHHMMKLSPKLVEQEGYAYVQQRFYDFLRRHLHG